VAQGLAVERAHLPAVKEDNGKVEGTDTCGFKHASNIVIPRPLAEESQCS
jgi:hypothetical protein